MVAIGPANSWIPENNNEPENNSKKKYKGVWIPIVVLITIIIGITGLFTYGHIQSKNSSYHLPNDKIYLLPIIADIYYCFNELTMYGDGHVVGTVYVPDGCTVDFGNSTAITVGVSEMGYLKDVKIFYPSTISDCGGLVLNNFYGNPEMIHKDNVNFLHYGMLKE